MMEAYTERMNQQREQEALLAAQREQELREREHTTQREQELLAQKQATQEKEEPPQNSDFHHHIGEMCGIKAIAGQKKNLEELMLELLELCWEKEFYCVHDSIEDLIGMAMNTMLLSINLKSQRLDKEKQEVKNIVEQATKRKTHEVIKSSVENLVPIPGESEDFSYNENTLIDSSSKFDYLIEEFSGELAHIDPIPPGIKEADFDLEEEIRLDTDSHMKEIDLFLATDDLMPPGIKNDDYDSEGDIRFLEELLSNDPLLLPENESSNFDHHDDPSFPRPPQEPPDVEVFFDYKPDTGVLTTKVVKGIFEHYVLMPNILPTLDPDLDFTPSHNSLGSRNKIFDQGIFIEV
uniref:Reverse transcriptase domain-containing protein n=1 Tax=Tanacetum cinerariifolium TaxID=118510 RepID=A0A6L2JJ52_TANCI|nr:hypothetical protein [Tanacetum cinerariifolium]